MQLPASFSFGPLLNQVAQVCDHARLFLSQTLSSRRFGPHLKQYKSMHACAIPRHHTRCADSALSFRTDTLFNA
eukprot:4581242-Amphidinium_carterae.2